MVVARSVAVVGAGPTGLAAALMLARQGRSVVVHEPFDTARPVGAGLMLQPTGLHVLDRLDLTGAIERLGQPIDHIFGREARRGRIVLDVRYRSTDTLLSYEALYIIKHSGDKPSVLWGEIECFAPS